MRDELQCAFVSQGLGKRKCTAGRARKFVSALRQADLRSLAEHADRIAANHVLWSRDGVRGNRNAPQASRFELNDAECVGFGLGNTNTSARRKMCGQGFPFQLAERKCVSGKRPPAARPALRSVANDDLSSHWQV